MKIPFSLLFLALITLTACGGGAPAEPPAASTAPAAEPAALPAATPAAVEAPAPTPSPAPLAEPAGPPLAKPAAARPVPVNPPFSHVDLTRGTGKEAINGRTIDVHYTLWLYDPAAPGQKGRQIDSSAGSTPLSFILGTGAVIRGWDQGFTGMKVGGKRRLTVPPDLGYGPGGAGGGIIPPNATLLFEMELMSVGD